MSPNTKAKTTPADETASPKVATARAKRKTTKANPKAAAPASLDTPARPDVTPAAKETAPVPVTLPVTDADLLALGSRRTTPAEMDAAGEQLQAAAAALVRAGRLFDAACTDDADNLRAPLGVEWALTAFARAVAEDLHARAGMALSVEPHGDDLVAMPSVPYGLPVAAAAHDLGVYVVGDPRPRGPAVRTPVKGHHRETNRKVGQTLPELRHFAEGVDFEAAVDLYHGPFGDLVALSALGNLDLPLVAGPHFAPVPNESTD